MSYFPHPLADPILHHREMMPQFDDVRNRRLNYENQARGLLQFALGSGKKVLLADNFADYSSITTEPVPRSDDTRTQMRWFWDARHYKPELGNFVLDRLLNIEVTDAAFPTDYGVSLNAGNIAAHLLAIRKRRSAYASAHMLDLSEIRANVETVIPARNSPIQ